MLAGVDADAWLEQLRAASAARSRCASAARSAGSPPRTPACTATRSASCRRAGLPEAFLADVPDALVRLVRRYARTHGPFTTASCARATALDLDAGAGASSSAPASWCAASCGPAAREREWCDPEVLRRLRRASLAVLRKEIEPADQRAFARFLPRWQGVDRHPAGGRGRRPPARGARAAAGPGAAASRCGSATCCRAASAPTRRRGWTSSARRGELVWVGAGALGPPLGPRGALLPRGRAAARPAAARPDEPPQRARARGASASGCAPAPASSPTCWPTSPARAEELQEALWDLVWAGEVTNDAFAPLRAPRLTLRAWPQRARADARGRALRRRAAARARSRRSRAAGR